MSDRPGLCLALAGLEIEGGIASVSRCAALACDDAIRAGRMSHADRVLLLDDPAHPPSLPAVGEQHLARGSMLRFVAQLWSLARRRRPDLVFVDQAGVARALLIPGLSGLRYTLFCHGEELLRAQSGIRRKAVKRAWRLLANSEHTAERIRRYFPECSDRTRVVPLCIDPRRIQGWDEPAPEEIGASRAPIALIVGRMWSVEPGKGHDALLDAWPAVRAAAAGEGAGARDRRRRPLPRPRDRRRAGRLLPPLGGARHAEPTGRASAWSTPRPCGTAHPASARPPMPPGW